MDCNVLPLVEEKYLLLPRISNMDPMKQVYSCILMGRRKARHLDVKEVKQVPPPPPNILPIITIVIAGISPEHRTPEYLNPHFLDTALLMWCFFGGAHTPEVH